MNPFELRWEKHSFTLTFFGEITCHTLLSANNALSSSPRLDTVNRYIFDFQQVTSLKLTNREVLTYARYDSVMTRFVKRSKMRGAYVTDDQQIADKLHEFLCLGHGIWERRVFNDIDLANNWLNSPETSDFVDCSLFLAARQSICE